MCKISKGKAVSKLKKKQQNPTDAPVCSVPESGQGLRGENTACSVFLERTGEASHSSQGLRR